MKQRIEFPPKAHLIQSLINTDLQYNEGLPELIDNAIDKRADRIAIEFDGRNMRVSDNGEGCPDLALMLAYGSSQDASGVGLGRYGVGLKNTACALAKKLSIQSVHGGFLRSVEIDWEKTGNSGWSADMEVEPTAKPPGTVVELVELYKRTPPLAALADDLEKMFWPAIKAGVQLTLDGDRLSSVVWPNYSEVHECSSVLGDGVSFSASGGIITPGQTNKGAGPFIISYRHRVIDPSCSVPVGDFMSSERFLCHVNLFESKKGQWELLKHKNGLRDSDMRARLYAVLESEYQPLLKKLHEDGELVEMQQLSSDVSLMLDGTFRGKEARKRGDSEGTANPTGTRPDRLTASEVSGPGKCKPRSGSPPKNGFFVKFQHLNGQIGKVDINGRRVQVILNINHAAIARWIQEKSREQLFTTALTLLVGHQVIVGRENPEQLMLPIEGGAYSSYVKTLSDCLAGLRKPAQ